MYIGEGQIVHSLKSCDVVKIVSVVMWGYVTARRVA